MWVLSFNINETVRLFSWSCWWLLCDRVTKSDSHSISEFVEIEKKKIIFNDCTNVSHFPFSHWKVFVQKLWQLITLRRYDGFIMLYFVFYSYVLVIYFIISLDFYSLNN